MNECSYQDLINFICASVEMLQLLLDAWVELFFVVVAVGVIVVVVVADVQLIPGAHHLK